MSVIRPGQKDGGAAFTARRFACWSEVSCAWHEIAARGHATPFQSPPFLDAWYQHFVAPGDGEAVIVEVRTAENVASLLLPLVLEREGRFRVIRFADARVSDNVAPLLGPAAPQAADAVQLAWKAVLGVLPAHDLIRFDKIPAKIGAEANPLLWLPGVGLSPLNAHPLQIGDDWQAYVRGRSKKFRKEQARVWRVFQRHDTARFEIISDPVRAIGLFDAFERQQSERLRSVGQAYHLDQPAYRGFYRALLEKGLPAGTTLFGALLAGDELVGGLLAICNRKRVVFVRLAHAGGEWGICSPGRLVIERVLEWAHAQGYRDFDFSIGDYAYKQDFGIATEPLYEYAAASSWKGLASASVSRVKRLARQSQTLRALAGRGPVPLRAAPAAQPVAAAE